VTAARWRAIMSDMLTADGMHQMPDIGLLPFG
jgi:hypothetical protein